MIDYDGDVLVNFFGYWCGYSKKLETVIYTVSKKIKDNNVKVKVALMENNLNEVEGVEVKRTPTLRLYPKGDKSKYAEVNAREMDEEKLLQFLRDNSEEFR